jgi:hypothetical protein
VARTTAATTPPDYESGGVAPDAVAAWLRLTVPADVDLLTQVCAAVNAWIARLPYVRSASVQLDPDVDAVVWPRDAYQGAVMLAARMYRRRNTPSGVEAMTDLVVYLPRRDSDVDQLLRIGAYARVQVG